MTAGGVGAAARVAEMRREFDAAFARPPAPEPPPAEPLLRVSAGGTRFFVRLRELACVLPCTLVVPVPGARRGLLGLTAVRGQVLPLYALATILDLPGPAAAPRWILVEAGRAGAGLGVEAVEGVSRIPETAVREAAAAARRAGGGSGMLQDSAGPRDLLDVAAVMDVIRKNQQPA
ncbi:MAG: purine-binding chemotaxis protein [Planctomycetota bacterium]|nr:MAG: purine-binding chemotaxis protein [Planctomycetota bacterium]